MNGNLVLLGYMGSGKSTVGSVLATYFQRTFIDLDQFIEKSEGMSVSEIFENRGVIYFRRIEKKALHEVLVQNSKAIIALGGGTPCYYDNMDVVNATSTSIYLQMNVKSLTDRLWGEKEQRPVIASIASTVELQEFIGKHLFERNFFYQKAQHAISISNDTVEEVAQKISSLLA
jgi:shikimate kinase